MRPYVPPEEVWLDQTRPGGPWGYGGGTLPAFVSEEAASWLLTADDDYGEHTVMRIKASDPIVTRPLMAPLVEHFGSRAAGEAAKKELRHTGLVGESGFFAHYRTPAGDIIAARLREQPSYRATT